MTSFLQQIAALFEQHYGNMIHKLAFVFPNRRSGLFFRKYLSQHAKKPLFSPTILTINELFLHLSDKQLADRIRTLFLLYRIFIRHSRSDEHFDHFINWGEMILNDFDDIDKYLVDAAHLFTNIKDIHQIDVDFSYLQPEQIEAIRTFWSSFRPEGNIGNRGKYGIEENHGTGENRQHFLDIWQHLYAIYSDLRMELTTGNCGYEGMIFREVAEKVKQGAALSTLAFDQIVFVGFNAITPAEKELMKGLQRKGLADFYWDFGSECLLDEQNKASHFIREHLKMFPSAFPLPEEKPVWPEIELIGIPSRIGQAKQVYPILKEMLEGNTGFNPEDALRTAIVLPDEQLLIPVLHAIPEEFSHINVTLGFSLSGTPVASLMESILNMQKKKRLIEGKAYFYYKDVISVLSHPYITSVCPGETAGLLKEITHHNRIFISTPDLRKSPILELIFKQVTEINRITDYLIQILMELNRIITSRHTGTEKDENEPISMGEMEQEFVYHYFTMANRLKEMIRDSEIDMTVETFFRLLKRLADTINIPFQGMPLSGIQIMGVLETRVLDFHRLIILSMNEGIFPARSTAGSFIPFHLRRGFGLPDYERQDSIWSYHFYRLIAGAKKVSLVYDTRTGGLQTGEVSRFVRQLKYQYGVPVKEKMVVTPISSAKPLTFQVEKNEEVMSKMKAYRTGGGKALSASTINTYLDCPLRFYFSAIEELKEEEEVLEGVESREFGTIFHRVAEWLYDPFCGKPVTGDLLKQRASQTELTRAIEHAFSELFFRSKEVQPLSGRHYLIGEVIRKYIEKLIEKDSLLTPFRYIRSEQKIQYPLRLSNGTEIQLKGFIDRLDEVDGAIRVVDYKTGSVIKLDVKSMESLFDPTAENRQSAIMQVFMYAYLFSRQDASRPVRPTLYYVRDFFSAGFNPLLSIGKEKEPVSDFSIYRNAFEDGLRSCLDRIFDPDIPFTQTSISKVCGYCPFGCVCGR